MVKIELNRLAFSTLPIAPSILLLADIPRLEKLDLAPHKRSELGQTIAIAIAADTLKCFVLYSVFFQHKDFELAYPILMAFSYYALSIAASHRVK